MVALASLLTAALASTAWAQELPVVARTRIPLGPGPQQVSVRLPGGEFSPPLFFAFDFEGLIHVPDPHKNRIALFREDGSFVRAVPTPASIGPSMNYFGLAHDTGLYVVVAERTLFLLHPDGPPRWLAPLGSIPSAIYLSREFFFVVLLADTLVFSYDSPRPLGTFGLSGEQSTIPLVRPDTGGTFAFRARNMRQLPGIQPDAYHFGTDPWFVDADAQGNSLWKDRRESFDQWYLADGQGSLVRYGTTPRGDGPPGSGFWSVVGYGMEISRATYNQDAMTIVTHTIR
jgi:hypothetical protein